MDALAQALQKLAGRAGLPGCPENNVSRVYCGRLWALRVECRLRRRPGASLVAMGWFTFLNRLKLDGADCVSWLPEAGWL